MTSPPHTRRKLRGVKSLQTRVCGHELTYVARCPRSGRPPGLGGSGTGCTGSPPATPWCGSWNGREVDNDAGRSRATLRQFTTVSWTNDATSAQSAHLCDVFPPWKRSHVTEQRQNQRLCGESRQRSRTYGSKNSAGFLLRGLRGGSCCSSGALSPPHGQRWNCRGIVATCPPVWYKYIIYIYII